MGNNNLKEIKVTNFIIEKENNFIPTPSNVEFMEKSKEKERINLQLITQEKTSHDLALLEKTFESHPIFSVLEKNISKDIIQQMSLFSSNKDQIIFSQGDIPWYFLILKEGTCDIIFNGQIIDSKKVGDCLDDMSLIYNCNRHYTLKTKTECKFWGLGRNNFEKIIEFIANLNFDEKKKNVNFIPLFSLDDGNTNIQNRIIYNLNKEKRNQGDIIITKEHITDCLYFIQKGEVKIKYDKYLLELLKSGDYFGELSLFFGLNRIFDYVAKDDCILYSLPISKISKILGNNYKMIILLNMIKSAFLKNKYFSHINLNFFEKIFDLFKLEFYDKEKIILQKDESISTYILIPIEGCLFKDEERTLICARGNLLFGNELFEQNKTPINFNIKCKSYSLIIRANTKLVLERIGCSFNDYIDKYSFLVLFKQIKLFKNLPDYLITQLFEKLKLKKISDKENIITKGGQNDELFIIKKGKVDLYINNNLIKTLSENEYFGEKNLLFESKNSDNYVANGECEILSLNKADFNEVIKEGELKNYIKNNIIYEEDNITLNDLIYIKNIAHGTYGNISLVKNKLNNILYAMKNIPLKQISSLNLMPNLEKEQNILKKISHPFIVKLIKILKDEKYIYYLTEYIKGKELFYIIRETNILNKSQAQFYISSILLSIKYLHENKIIHRDIRPENIMIQKSGYIKLIDFGNAKELESENEYKTKTIIGTPYYMAPEVILGDNYSFEIDYWSIGVCLYELCCGILPFGNKEKDPFKIYISILNDSLIFPDFIKDNKFKNLVFSMLNKKKDIRYCNYEQISCHTWFEGFDWDSLLSFDIKPSYIPNIEDDIFNEKDEKPYLDFINELKEWNDNEEIIKEDKSETKIINNENI